MTNKTKKTKKAPKKSKEITTIVSAKKQTISVKPIDESIEQRAIMMSQMEANDKKIYDLKFKTNECRKEIEMLYLMF